MKQKNNVKETSIVYNELQIKEIINELFEFLHEKPENIFVDEFIILQKKILHSDFEILKHQNEFFKISISDAMKIEKTKLKKFAAADRLNATFVKTIIERDHPLEC